MSTINVLDQIGMQWVQWVDEHGMPHEEEIPTYVCGHCNEARRLRPDRTRPRVICKGCGSIICEGSELCQKFCTPTFIMAKNQWAPWGQNGKYIRPIFAGCKTEAEAEAWLAANPLSQ